MKTDTIKEGDHVRKLRLWLCSSVAFVAAIAFADTADRPELGSFRRLMFNNPGLEVDLGLGIWPFAEVFD